jgi:hypothetical protein
MQNGTATDEVIKEQVKVLGQEMTVTSFVHKNSYVFCYKKLDYSKHEYCIRWY